MKATIGAACVVAFFVIMQVAGGLALTGGGWAVLIGSALLAFSFDLIRTPAPSAARKASPKP